MTVHLRVRAGSMFNLSTGLDIVRGYNSASRLWALPHEYVIGYGLLLT